jgi:hypothetical protein
MTFKLKGSMQHGLHRRYSSSRVQSYVLKFYSWGLLNHIVCAMAVVFQFTFFLDIKQTAACYNCMLLELLGAHCGVGGVNVRNHLV